MLQGMSPEDVMLSGKGQTQNGTYLYDSMSVKYPEEANALRQNADWWCQGLRRGIGNNHLTNR